MDSSGIIGNYENDDLENEIYEEDQFLQRNLIEENCDTSANDDENIVYISGEAPPPPAHASMASFQSQVNAFVNATAALRRQLSSSSNNSGNGSTATSLLDALRVADFDTQSNGGDESKLSWRKIFLGESAGQRNVDAKDVRSNSGVRNYKKNARVWDDDFVLRRQFAALIPAFDPRPGRTNVNQVLNLKIYLNKLIILHRLVKLNFY